MKNELMRYICVTMVVLMAVGRSSTYIPTGGTSTRNKENEQNIKPPPSIRGRECSHDSNCTGLATTVCIHDSRDRKLRCLCVNKSPPVNGGCPKYPKALGSACNADKECVEMAHCSTQTNSSLLAKTCMCKESYYEEDHMCNAGFLSTTPSIMSLLFAVSTLCLASKSDSTF